MNLTVALDPGERQDLAALVIVDRILLARDEPTDPTRFHWDAVPVKSDETPRSADY